MTFVVFLEKAFYGDFLNSAAVFVPAVLVSNSFEPVLNTSCFMYTYLIEAFCDQRIKHLCSSLTLTSIAI